MSTLVPLFVRPDWYDRARCAGLSDRRCPDPADTHETAGFRARPVSVRECEVRPECLAMALERGEQHGMWGGLSERQRRNERAVRRWVAS